MAENRRARRPRSYYFSRGQLAILTVGFTVTCAIIFFLGIFIGQGIEERKLLQKGSDEAVTKIPLRALPGEARRTTETPADQEMTFYDTLTKRPPSAKGKTRKREKRVQSAQRKKKIAKAEVPLRSVKRKKPTLTKTPQKKSSLSSQTKGTIWSVQVKAYTRRGDARILANKLKDKGYDAYVISITIKGRSWHRVRVGHLATQSRAKLLLERIKKQEKYTKAIITREGS